MPDSAATSDAAYVAHRKVYPREVTGRFNRLRVAAVWGLLGLFYLVAWIPWGGRQAVLFDLPARKFYVFGLVFWPQDFFFLAWLLIIAALALFFFTAFAGRLWCGYACPQTVWTEAFVWMERLVEGSRSRQMKLDRGPWTAEKVVRKGAKHALWLAFAAWTGFTFVGYFTPIGELGTSVLAFRSGPWETFWIVFYGLATYCNAGFLREQVCLYMCPYARFQSAMFDRDTLIISYDPQRGEPRGPRPRGSDPRSRGLGDCVDCTLCVQACPTGIDIRKGLQYECIACAACIDACDGVMDRLGYARGLIRYATDRSMSGGATRLSRPRILIYGTLLAILIVAFGVAVAARNPVAIDVMRDRNALYRELPGGVVENSYAVRLMNKAERERRYVFSVESATGVYLDDAGVAHGVAAGSVSTLPLRLRAPAGTFSGSRPVTVRVTALDDARVSASVEARFLMPSKAGT